MGWIPSGGGTSLEIKEADGSPDVTGVSTITVTSGTLTDSGGGAVALSIGASGANTALSNVDVQTAARVFAGPVSGAAAAPTFRAIATTDLKSPDASGFLSSNGSGVLSWATPAGTGANTALSNLASVAINSQLTTAPGLEAGLVSASALPDDSSQDGPGAYITAANATEGTVNPSASSGGSVNITAGDAARLTSGNANGGDIVITPGAGIGTGAYGIVRPSADNILALGSSAYRFTTGFASTGWAIYKAASDANPTATLGDGLLNMGAGGASAVDVGIARSAAGVMTVTDGSSGTGNVVASTAITAVGTAAYNGVIRTGVYKRAWTNAEVVAFGAVLSGDLKVATLPAKTIVRNAYLVIDSQASGTTTLTASFGRTSAAYIDYIVASDAKVAANTVYGDVVGERGTNLTGYDLPSYTAAVDIYVQFVATDVTKKLADVLGCTGQVYLLTETLP